MKRSRKKEYKITVVGGRKREWNQSEEGFEAFYNILISAAKLKAAGIVGKMKDRNLKNEQKGGEFHGKRRTRDNSAHKLETDTFRNAQN